MSEVSNVDLTSIFGDLLAIVAQEYDPMETDMKDNIIQWGESLLVQDLSDNDVLMHSHFCKAHRNVVAVKLWPRLQCFLWAKEAPSR